MGGAPAACSSKAPPLLPIPLRRARNSSQGTSFPATTSPAY
jgi:hypothetical protein